MNKLLMYIIIIINGSTLLFAGYWFIKEREPTAIFVILVMLGTLIALYFKNKHPKNREK